MKKNILQLFRFLFVIIFITNSCKEKERTPAIYNIDQELKDWMFFDTSTWWLYQNVKTGELDSQYVTKSEIYYTESENIKGKPYIKSQLAEVYLNNQTLYYLTSQLGDYIMKRSKNGSYTFLVYKPLTIGERRSSYSSQGYTEIKAIDNNFTLDNVYSNTKITLLDGDDGTENDDSVQYQVFKGIGIINKKNITKNEEWKLIKYRIKLNKN